MDVSELWRRSPMRSRVRREVFARFGDVCWLCGRPGADSVDHLLPKSQYPQLMFVVDNMRPAHRRCNSKRGAAGISKTKPKKGKVETADGW